MGIILDSSHQTATNTELSKALQHALEQAQSRYVAANPKSKQKYEDACNYMPGGNTRTVLHISPFALTIDQAESCYLTTIDGTKYVDFLGEYTAGIYGHNNPAIRKAVQSALDGGWNYGGVSRMEGQFAKTICERFTSMELVRFVNSGTEANMMALATAVAFTGKQIILVFYGAYHGGTISGKIHPGKANINLPHHFIVGKYNDMESTTSLVNTIKDNLAAIIIEPMLGSGGCFPAKAEFLQLLRNLASEHGAMLICDEVMTSRLAYHGFSNAHGIKPDLMTIGKWVGGGMTFGAFGGREALMSMYDPRTGQLDHPGTFNNNVFTMTAGIAGCGILHQDRLQQLNDLGYNMRHALADLFSTFNIAGLIPEAPLDDQQHLSDCKTRPPKMFVTGRGSMMNMHFGGPDRGYLQGLYYHHMLEHNVYLAARGFIALSIEITQSHVNLFLDATKAFCEIWQNALRW